MSLMPIAEEPPKMIHTAKVIKIENGKAVIGIVRKPVPKKAGEKNERTQVASAL